MLKPVIQGERTGESAPKLLYLAIECGDTQWVSEEDRDTGMDTVECETEDCAFSMPGRRTWVQLWAEQ
jgi:hypothetical protein